MYVIDLTVEFFYFLHVSVFLSPTYENEKKSIPFQTCFRDIGLQNRQISERKYIDVNVKRDF